MGHDPRVPAEDLRFKEIEHKYVVDEQFDHLLRLVHVEKIGVIVDDPLDGLFVQHSRQRCFICHCRTLAIVKP